MAKQKAVKGNGAEAGKTTTKRTPKAREVKQPSNLPKVWATGGKTVQPRVWRRMARLAGDALVSLQEGNTQEVRSHLEAILAVALCADQQQQ